MPDEEQKTRSEWERERASDLATRDALKLAEKAAGLEYDLRAVRQERDALKAAQPPEGSVVLSKADADRWTAYSALGKPDELQAALTDRDTARADLSGRDRRDSIRTAAEAAGYKASVLEKLTPDGASYEVRETQVDGKAARFAFLKLADGTEKPLTEWATTEHADFLPALAAAPTMPTSPPPASWVPQPTAPPTNPAGTPTDASPWTRFNADRAQLNAPPATQ